MSLLARNITADPAVAVPLNDLGITISASEDRDLHDCNTATGIAESANLVTAINADEILILDPGGSALSKADSLLVAAQGMLVRIVTP